MAGLHPLTVFSVAISAVSLCLTIFLMPMAGNRVREEVIEMSLPRNECKVPRRVSLYVRYDAIHGELECKVSQRNVHTDAGMIQAIRNETEGLDIPVGLDAHPQMPWSEVLRLIGILKHSGFRRIDLMSPGGF